uniref:Ubiquitin-like domain-containing protein n=1 Tax=Monopterus albus TaxID=43700 RepID=A0A3Q3JY26_MONAL
MEITITMLNGMSRTLTVSPQDTVGRLKTLIHGSLGEAPHTQRLVLDRIDLSDDSKPLSSYGVQHDSRVALLVTEPQPVFLINDKDTTNTYKVRPDETVSNFKRRVESREGVPVSQQMLLYQSRELNGGKLSDYNIEKHSTIYLCLRLRGGCGHSHIVLF